MLPASSKSPFTASKLLMSNADKERVVETASSSGYSESSSFSEDDSSEDNATTPVHHQGQHGTHLTGKDLAFRHRFGMLPTAKNKANRSIPNIFTAIARHRLPENLG